MAQLKQYIVVFSSSLFGIDQLEDNADKYSPVNVNPRALVRAKPT